MIVCRTACEDSSLPETVKASYTEFYSPFTGKMERVTKGMFVVSAPSEWSQASVKLKKALEKYKDVPLVVDGSLTMAGFRLQGKLRDLK